METGRETQPPRPARGRFAGISTSIALGLLTASGGILGAGLALALDRLESRELGRIWEELETQKAVGEQAYRSLDAAEQQQRAQTDAQAQLAEALATAQAQAWVLGAAPPVTPGSAPGWIGHLEGGRVYGLVGAGLSQGATLALARPELVPLLKGSPTVSTPEGVWAVAPGSQPRLAFVPRRPAGPGIGLDDPKRLLGALAAPVPPPGPVRSPWPIFLGVALVAGLGGGLYFGRRWSAPIGGALQAARDFDHGQHDARAQVDRGGREAREVARGVNALIERAERHQAQGRAARTQDVQGAALAIINLGRGDLRGPTPALGEPFEPLAIALEGARRDLIERVTDLHQSSTDIAQSAVGIGPSAKRVSDAAADQRDALHHLGEGLSRAKEEVLAAHERMEAALAGLGRHGAEQRRTLQEVRASLLSVGRRLSELGAIQARTAELVQSSASLDQALSLLSRLAARHGDDGVDLPPARITAMVGEGRAAFEAVQRGLLALKEELSGLGSALEQTAAAQPELGGDPRAELTGPLFDLASTLIRVAELAGGSLKALERAHRGMADGAGELLETAQGAQGHLKDLAPALAGIRVGGAFEEALLSRLQQALQEVEAAQAAPEQLTPDGQQLLFEVRAASEAARARLARLVEATETALSVLRS